MPADPNVLVGFETGDDAAVYRVTDDLAMVLTLDFFPPIVDDPGDYGAIAVANAVSDIYALGARPVAGLNIAGFPGDLPTEIIGEILSGGARKAAEAGFPIIGGHTVRDNEPKYGLAVIGFLKPGEQVTNAAARPGDKLVLTKPLGTGIISTAGKAQAVEPSVMTEAVRVMSVLNRDAADVMTRVGVNAATDVTGYGLTGHLMSMARGSGTRAIVSRSSLPVLPGALELLGQGMAPGGTHRNLESMAEDIHWDASLTEADRLLMADPQTSGGLLMSVAPERLDDLLSGLRQAGVPSHVVVGEMVERGDGPLVEAHP